MLFLDILSMVLEYLALKHVNSTFDEISIINNVTVRLIKITWSFLRNQSINQRGTNKRAEEKLI